MERSFDHNLMRQASEAFNGPDFDYEGWLANHRNIMFVKGEDVGLLTYDYPGVYTGHWFYKSRGKDAIKTASEMLSAVFTDGAKAVRGITPVGLKGARFLAKMLGFVSLGIEEYPDGLYEIMCLTKDEFNNRLEQRNG